MKKMTKTRGRNLVEAIRSKAFQLFGHDLITSKDYDGISKIMIRAKNRLK